jgi:hypothetical protein
VLALGGWNSITGWGDDGWGESSLNFTGTGEVGTVALVTDQVIAVTGLSATGQIGDVFVVHDQVLAVAGVE